MLGGRYTCIAGKDNVGKVTTAMVVAGGDTLENGASGLATFTKACKGPVGFRRTGLGEHLARELRQLPNRLEKQPTRVAGFHARRVPTSTLSVIPAAANSARHTRSEHRKHWNLPAMWISFARLLAHLLLFGTFYLTRK